MIIDSVALGATLYLPATRGDLDAVIGGARLPGLRSAVIDLEDSIRPDDVPLAMQRLAALLAALPPRPGSSPGQASAERPLLFVRPRDAAMLARILAMPGVEQADGFVLPKATAETLPTWLTALTHDHHLLMPTLETREVFEPAEMRRLREQLLAIRDRVLAIRIGGNDLLQTLGARRSAVRTAYDGPLGTVIAGLVATFRPWGFALSAPVFEGIADGALLAEEVERDIEHGLLTKTAIHPAQLGIIQSAYAVASDELATARAMLAEASPAVFALAGAMCEPATHRVWAEGVLRRAAVFGVRREIASLAG